MSWQECWRISALSSICCLAMGRLSSYVSLRIITPWKFNSSPLKISHPKRKGSSSNHDFSGVNSLLNFGGVFCPLPTKRAEHIPSRIIKSIHLDIPPRKSLKKVSSNKSLTKKNKLVGFLATYSRKPYESQSHSDHFQKKPFSHESMVQWKITLNERKLLLMAGILHHLECMKPYK